MIPVRIFVADDHAVVRRGLRALLQTQPGWEVCGEAANGREAVEQVRKLRPAVAILDISMPELNGLDVTRKIMKDAPETEVLVLTMHASEEVACEVLRAGARGYVLKSDADPDLVTAVKALLQHKPFLSSNVTEFVVDRFVKDRTRPSEKQELRSRLTDREREVLQLLAEGKSNKEVAAVLEISTKTVEAHRANIVRKLGLRSFSDLVRYAIRNKMVEP